MFGNTYHGKKVLVTGHTGFKGSWLTTWLLQLGADVVGYSDNIPTTPSHFNELNLSSKISHNLGDIRDLHRLLEVCDAHQPEFIFHLAAQPLVRESYQDPHTTFEVNSIGTLNVLELTRLKDYVKICVCITSDKCYDNVEWVYGYRETDRLGGEDPYSGSKGCAELIANSYMKSFFKSKEKRVVTTRAGNVIGGGDWAKDRIIPDIVRSWENGNSVDIRNPHSTRPWQHVLEPLSGYLWLGSLLYKDSQFCNQSFNFGPDSDVNKTVAELIEHMKRHWENAPGWNDLSESRDKTKPESNLLKLCCDRANIELKWYPSLTFEETIDFTVDWYTGFYIDKQDIYNLTTSQIMMYAEKANSKKIAWAV